MVRKALNSPCLVYLRQALSFIFIYEGATFLRLNMFKYKFEINKEGCWAYWAQSSIRWNWYFNQGEANKWKEFTGEFTVEEENGLNRLREILQKEGNAYLWLWDRYENNQIENKEGKESWEKIKSVLADKFEKIWQIEKPKLEAWKKELEQLDLKDKEDNLKRIFNFFGVFNQEKEIKAKLLFGFGKKAGGATKKEFPNSMILLLSGADLKDRRFVLNVLLHESLHLLEYSSEKDLLFRQSFKEILAPLKIKQSQPSWRHLITESIIGSIIGRGVGCWDKGESKEITGIFVDKEKNRNHFYNQKILLISQKLAPLTEKYLKNNKEMDSVYTDQVLEILKEELVD